MKRTIRLATFAIALMMAGNAEAGRWIVQNPTFENLNTLLFHALKVKHTIEIGDQTFWVIETPDQMVTASGLKNVDATMVKSALSATEVAEDLPLELIDSKNQPPIPLASAWHVSHLKYDQLPSQFHGQGVIVGIVDTGVDYNHPALAPKMWKNAEEIPGNQIDDDGNGYVDDVYGYDFTENKSDPMDQHSHGTHCAGIVSSVPQQGSNAQGVAPGAKIMAIKIIGSNARTFLSDAARAIKYGVDNGANILSNSWRIYKDWSSFDPSEKNLALLKAAIQYAADRDVLFVAAAGNERRDNDNLTVPIFPVGYDGLVNLVGVSASNQTDGMASFTNYGATKSHVAAPGVSIISTIPNGRWSAKSGTSMAAPLVAGALARALSKGALPLESVSKLIKTSDEKNAWIGKAQSNGVVNLIRYLESI